MTENIFAHFLENVCSYFEKRQPSINTQDLWYDRARNIPDQAMDWLEKRIQEEFEMFPRNLPSVMWALYRRWLESDPTKQSEKTYFDCPECDGMGNIFLKKYNELNNARYYYVFACARCGQNINKTYPRSRLPQLLKAGYEEHPQIHTPGDVSRNLRSMVAGIGKEVRSDERSQKG